MSTIEDVAKRAGVSKATVSRVMNGLPTVTRENIDRVQKAMRELAFVPNLMARNLRNKKTGVIAAVVQVVSNPFFSKLVHVMGIRAEQLGYRLLICQSEYNPESEQGFLNLLKTGQVDGMIFASFRSDWTIIKDYLGEGPIVLCNEFDAEAGVPVVCIDHHYGAYIATKHLLVQGHRRIAYCTGSVNRVGAARKEGFLQAHREYGVPFDERLTYMTAFDSEDGRNIFYWIRGLDEPPSAIFTGSDEVAAGIVSESRKFGWSIPGRLAVVGFDDLPIARIVEPNLTTVQQPIRRMAEKAVEVLVGKINEGGQVAYERHEFPVELIIRESTLSRQQ
jgi:LacI family repressor for deo operon, udp, cdd, tsx, nupC, and nupG